MKIRILYKDNDVTITQWFYNSGLFDDASEALKSLKRSFSHIPLEMYRNYVLPVAKKFENITDEEADLNVTVYTKATKVIVK